MVFLTIFFHLSISAYRLVVKTPCCHTSDCMGQFCQNFGVQATMFLQLILILLLKIFFLHGQLLLA